MQLIKEKIRSIGRDVSIKIPLSSNKNSSGLQQEINNYVEEQTGLSINPVVDGEKIRFKTLTSKFFYPVFFNNGIYLPNLTNNGFTSEEIAIQSNVKTNSFYIFQIYDSIVRENQLLLHTSYLNGFDIVETTNPLGQQLLPNSETLNFYIPKWWIDENVNQNNQITFYMKLLFFNAKTGKIQVFFNTNKNAITSEDKLYYSGTLFINNKTYTTESNQLIFSEFPSSDYTNKINNTINTFNNELPQFPSGTRFNPDGSYDFII